MEGSFKNRYLRFSLRWLAHSGAVGQGTALQAGRSRSRFSLWSFT